VSGALEPSLDLRACLFRAEADGVAVVTGALVPVALPPLIQLLDRLPFFTPPAEALPFATACELAVLHDLDRTDQRALWPLRALGDELAERVRRDGADVAELRHWRPNEVFVRRYRPDSTGLGPHRDGLRFRHLIATVSVVGTATFVRCDDDDRIVEQWALLPGDIVLLRGPDRTAVGDRRPRHAVSGPHGRARCSIAFRMRVEPDGPSVAAR
jgi:hypothetical protein